MSQILVGTAANDGTGDPIRTAFQKVNQSMMDCFNVRYYGAKGDGATDDTTAIQAAITAAGAANPTDANLTSAMVYLPPGIYNITTTLTIPNQVVVFGAGRLVSEIRIAGGWTNPSPNVMVRLGNGGSSVFGSRVENLTISVQNTANVYGLYGSGIQDLCGARCVTIRAFGAGGVLIASGSASPVSTNNAYVLEHMESLNGIAATGIAFDLDGGAGGATFTPTLIGLSASNAAFPASKAPAGFRFSNGNFIAEALRPEYYTEGVQFGGLGSARGFVNGISANNCTDGLFMTGGSIGVQATAILNPSGTNLVNDSVNSVVIPVSGNNYVSLYAGGGYQPILSSGVATAKAALTYGVTVTPNLGMGSHFTLAVTNGTGYTFANPVGYVPSTGSAMTQEFTVDFYNNSGGAMGAVTFGALYKLTGAFTAPANANHRFYRFYWDGTNWREVFRSAADQAH